jgi:hypothetical protein
MAADSSGPPVPPPEFGPVPEQAPPLPPHVRKYSVLQRLWLLFVSPREAMRDIALAPEYGGVILIIGLQVFVSAVMAWMILQKFTFVGVPVTVNMTWLWSLVAGILVVAFVVGGVGVVLKWLVKSWLVKSLCNSGSGWNFRTAAAVTGYAYVADLVITVINVVLVWVFVPQFVIDVSNPDAAAQAIASYNSQLVWQRFLIMLPLGFVGLV